MLTFVDVLLLDAGIGAEVVLVITDVAILDIRGLEILFTIILTRSFGTLCAVLIAYEIAYFTF